jgi:hypothetical protein
VGSDVYKRQGATNATWVWCPNISSTLTTPMSQVYPGDGYVDWLCLDGYNQFTHGSMPWFSFKQVFKGDTAIVSNSKDSYQEITAVSSKPLMIGETGSLEYGDGGTKKGQWMQQMLTEIPSQLPRIKALVYFNWNDNNTSLTWPIESSTASKNGFSSGIQAAVYARNVFQNLPKFSKITAVDSAPQVVDTIGVYKAGKFYLRNSNSTGGADITITLGGDASDLPVAGDWNGDSIDTVGVYRSSTGVFYLADSNFMPQVVYTAIFGNPGDTPFAGRWTSSMNHDGIGVFRPTNGLLYQKTSVSNGFSDYFAVFGNPGDAAFAGDWNGDGLDAVGVYRPGTKQWYFSNNGQPSGITVSDLGYSWDISTNIPVVGDWDGNRTSTSGAYSASGGTFTLSNTNAPTTNFITFAFGPTGGKPISGKWTASGSVPAPLSNIIVYDGTSPQPSQSDDLGSVD